MAAYVDIVHSNRCKIIIIGAGMAGLSAANHLVKNGFTDFKILEARDRIGGRIEAIHTGDHKVELGANWIHGVLGNPIYELAMANGLIDIVHVPKPHKIIAATEDGKQVPFPILQEIYEAYVCFLHRCEEYFLCHYLPPDGITSVGRHIGLESALYLQNLPDGTERHLRQLIFDCLLKRETCISGCHSMEEIDLLEMGSYTELQGGNIILPSGYSSILEPVSRHIPPDNVLLRHPVASVRWRYADEVMIANLASPGEDSGIGDAGNDSDDSDRTVTDVPVKPVAETEESQSSASSSLHDKEADLQETLDINECIKDEKNKSPPNVAVTCENGLKFYADHIICTIPLGVLKEKASSLFVPHLPPYKLESIEKLLFGTVNKIFLEYDRPFLNPNISEIMFIWETGSEEESNLTDDALSECWYRKIYSFSKVTDTMLLGWISGREAEFMEKLPREQIAEKCTEILRRFLNDPFVPKPKKCICTSWHQDPYSVGSYTAVAVGASQVDIQHLAQPLYANSRQKKPALMFAGEHTHASFYSTVHGAYLTGRSAAQALLRPESPDEIVLDCDTSDLSSWIQGIDLAQ